MREWLAGALAQIALVFISLCGMLSPEVAVETVNYVVKEINMGIRKEKIVEEQDNYRKAVKK